MRKPFDLKKKLILALSLLLVATGCYAQELSLSEKISYRQVKIVSPIGQETKALVGRFSGKVEYIWNGRNWTPAPNIFQQYYDDRKRLRELDRRNRDIRYRLQQIAASQKAGQ
ncbi:MAG: hypothetical protein WC738_07175 [Candidatus Omnitrophota bacterium]|jgi:hypothetical protein